MNQNNYDQYWNSKFNHIERTLSWFFLILGFTIIASYALLNFLMFLFVIDEINFAIKIGLFLIIAGLILLFISILREKVYLNRKDKYGDIKE